MTEPMLALAQLVATVLTLVPVAVVVALSARRNGALWRLAAAIPTAVAVDLLVTMLLCRIVRLEIAAFASRALWLAGGAWLLLRRRKQGEGAGLEWPAALDRRALAALGLAALAAAVLSLILSRPYAIWDRELHIPVVSALRGQRIPFASAFEPGAGFHYHFTGNVLAAMVQTFSFAVLNASLALSLAHDIVFVLIALSLGLAMLAAGRPPVHVIVLGVVAVLLSGPCLLRFGVGEPFLGYNYYGFHNWAFRPANSLTLLMLSGLVAVLLARGCEPAPPDAAGRTGLGALAAMVTVLAVTDETATGVLGLCLGIAWLFDWRLLGPRRRDGAWLLGALAIGFVVTNVLFDASLTGGSPAKLALVAPRSPGVQQPALPLNTGAAWVALIADTVPIWAVAIAIAAAMSTLHRDPAARRPGRGLLAFLTALLVVSLVGLTCVEGNGSPRESHRFLTAALWMFPAIGVLAFDWWPPGTLRRALVLGALGLGAFSSLLWLSHYPKHPTPERWFRARGPGLHDTSCRTVAGAQLGETPALVYIEASVFYSYAGCRPTFVAGQRGSLFEMKLRPTLGLAGFQQLDREMLKPDQAVDAICPADRSPADVDVVCAHALRRTRCAPEGTAFLRCPLSPADRRAILGR
jgi:hypothetical protein